MLGEDRGAAAELAQAPDLAAQPPPSLLLLADLLAATGQVPRAVEVLRPAQRRHPNDFWLNHQLAYYLMRSESSQPAQAVGYFGRPWHGGRTAPAST